VNECGSSGTGLSRRWLLPGLALVLAACGGSGGTGSSANAPLIGNLRVSYSPPPALGAVTQVSFIFDVSDADGDWVLGRCTFITGVLEPPIQTGGLPTNATSGTGTCVVSETFTNTERLIELVIEDQAGHQSNVVSALVIL